MTGFPHSREDVGRALAELRRRFGAALEGDNAFTIAGTSLRADQVRGIASMVGGDDGWTERDGRAMIRNDTVLGRAFLSYGVGTGRHLSADDFASILAGLLAGSFGAARESDVAQFVNLVAAEPRHDPRVELPIWAAVAHKLATGRGRDAFSQEIPGLLTGHDPLHAEIPPGAQLAEGLLPGARLPVAPTLERYVDGLAATAGPDLERYVGEHLLSRLPPGPS